MPLTILIMAADDDTHQPTEAQAVVVEIQDSTDLDWTRLPEELLKPLDITDGFSFTTSRSVTEWGASAEFIEIGIFLTQVALARLIEYGIERAVGTVVAKVREDRPPPAPLTSEEAVRIARYRVSTAHGYPVDALFAVEVTTGGSVAVVVLVFESEATGVEFRVSLERLGGVTIERIERLS